MQVTTIGLDLAKHVFQVHGVNATGQVVVRKRLRRAEVLAFFAGLDPCLVGMEACATVRDRTPLRWIGPVPGRHGGLRDRARPHTIGRVS